MPDTDYARVKALFEAVCELPDAPARRAALQALGASPALADRVLALCGRADAGRDPLAAPVAALLDSLSHTRPAGAEPQLGDRLGAWTLCGELGEGGMGRVFLAERSDGHYQQRAAIKVLRTLRGERAQAQLARERQILAGLNHPNIARLLDGGTTPGGQPFLVMEHVAGQRIDAHCAAHQLGLGERLALFQRVCEAVAYSHQQWVLHCDIKPGNVLVDAEGSVRLLDFGIAQLVGQAHSPGMGPGDSDSDTPGRNPSAPGTGTRAFTPRYASPEQMAGAPTSAASDVFSLGRLLEKLLVPLAGQAPRETEWRALIARATQPEPAARYASVAELMADLHRFAGHFPLHAMPAVWRYRSAKLLRRHWPWVLTGAGVLVLSLGFTAGLVQQRDRALLAETQARQEAATAHRVSELLTSVFEAADPEVAGRHSLSAADLVDQSRDRILSELGDQPVLQAELLRALGKVYRNMGQPRQSIALWEQARALLDSAAHPTSASGRQHQAELLRELAYVLSNNQAADRALPLARQALTLAQAEGTPLAQAQALNCLGWVLSRTSAYAESRQRLNAALGLLRQHGLGEHTELPSALNNLARLDEAEGDFPSAEAHLRHALSLSQSRLGLTHPRVQNLRYSLGLVMALQSRYTEAGKLFTELLAQYRQRLGPRSAQVAMALGELAGTLQDSGQTTQALAAYRETLAILAETNGRHSIAWAVVRNNMATAQEDAGDPGAEAGYREALAIRQAQTPPAPLGVARGQANLGRWLLRAGRLREARPLLQSALDTRLASLSPSHPDVLDGRLNLAELALTEQQTAAAAALLGEPPARSMKLRPGLLAHALHLHGVLALARAAQPGPAATQAEQARSGLAQLNEARALMQAQLPPRHPKRLRLERSLAQAQARWGRG